MLPETLSLKKQDSEKNGLVALGHTTLIKEGTFQTLVLQTPGGVGSGLAPPPDHPSAGNTRNKKKDLHCKIAHASENTKRNWHSTSLGPLKTLEGTDLRRANSTHVAAVLYMAA